MNYQLTVIIPVYNDSTNIIRCLDSVFSQSFKQLEVIVINDASTDNTLRVLRKYNKEYPINIMNLLQNIGAGGCRNLGIHASKTSYITFLDSDDWIDFSTYERCFDAIIHGVKPDPDIVMFGLMYDYPQYNRRVKKYAYDRQYEMSGSTAIKTYSHTVANEIKITPIVNNKLYRRKFLMEKGIMFIDGLRFQEDDAFTFEALAQAEKVFAVGNCFYHYCQRKGSVIHNVSESSINGFVEAYKKLKLNLEQKRLFDLYEDEFYLKMKGSLLGVIKRTIDCSDSAEKTRELVSLLIKKLIKEFEINRLLATFDFETIRRFL
ncbi:MAG: glycosyltransferase family 2 protein [Lachnospiraceae bacterium]|nr:glycosyltransferase family 2 protein [Lachnospiraceae bacterium]